MRALLEAASAIRGRRGASTERRGRGVGLKLNSQQKVKPWELKDQSWPKPFTARMGGCEDTSGCTEERKFISRPPAAALSSPVSIKPPKQFPDEELRTVASVSRLTYLVPICIFTQ